MSTEVSKNEDGTWHAPGAGDHKTKHEAQEALDAHQAELQAAREEREAADGNAPEGTYPGRRSAPEGAPDGDVATMTPAELMDYVDNAPIAARPARRADLTGQGRTLDAVGNETS